MHHTTIWTNKCTFAVLPVHLMHTRTNGPGLVVRSVHGMHHATIEAGLGVLNGHHMHKARWQTIGAGRSRQVRSAAGAGRWRNPSTQVAIAQWLAELDCDLGWWAGLAVLTVAW